MTKTKIQLWCSRLLFLAMLFIASMVTAAPPVYEIHISNHLFQPAELTVPANKKVKLVIINMDPTPEEFESFELNREKIIMGKRKGTIFLGPLKPGIYPFFGEFNPKTAQGKIIAK